MADAPTALAALRQRLRLYFHKGTLAELMYELEIHEVEMLLDALDARDAALCWLIDAGEKQVTHSDIYLDEFGEAMESARACLADPPAGEGG